MRETQKGLVPSGVKKEIKEAVINDVLQNQESKNRPQSDMYGECKIDEPWENLEDLKRNLSALPEATRRAVVGELGGNKGGVEDVRKEMDPWGKLLKEKGFIKQTPEEHAEEFVDREGRNKTVKYLGGYLMRFGLARTDFHSQIEDKYLTEEISESEIASLFEELMDNVLKTGEMPYESSRDLRAKFDDIKKREEALMAAYAFKEEEAIKFSKKLGSSPRASRRSEAGKKLDQMLEDLKKLKSANECKQLALEREREPLQSRLEDAKFFEALCKKIKPTAEDVVEIFLDFAEYIPDHTIQGAALDGILDWMDKHPTGDEEKRGFEIHKKIELLRKHFLGTFEHVMLDKREDIESTRANVQHAQILLRKLLRLLEEEKTIK